MNDIKNFENILHGIENEEVEKAIKYFKHLIKTWIGSGSQNHYRLAIQALEKQVPKKPVKCTTNKPVKIGNVTFSKGTSIYKCPNCGGLITYYKYCCSCGQAIDWRNEDE